MKKYLQTGFSLIELLITLAIAGILLSLAAPSFSTITKNSRIRSQISDFHLSLLLARNEAITRISRVTVCSSSTGSSCNVSNWALGWIVFIDDNNNAIVDAGEEILRVHQNLEGGNTLVGNSPVSGYISYVGNGRTMRTSGALQMGTIVLCDDRGIDNGRAIVFNAAGRPSIRNANDSSFSDCTTP